MSEFVPNDFIPLLSGFEAPINRLDCGKKCSPHNTNGKPFCCDTLHAIPTVYNAEWEYLKDNTDLWHLWSATDNALTGEEVQEEEKRLTEETPEGMILLACLGPDQCQREFRSISCRQFPFFPYVDSKGEFLGLSYYWDFEDVCWLLSNLDLVEPEYRSQFIRTYELLFEKSPEELESYKSYSEYMRDTLNEKRRAVPLLHRNGHTYKISSHNERMRRVSIESLPKFGPYKITTDLPFPEEIV